MKNSRNWIKNGLLLAAIMAVVFVMASSGMASVEKLWTEKETVTNQDVSPIGGTLFRGLAEKLSPAVVNVRPMKKVTRTYSNFPYGMPRMTPPQMKPHGSNEFRQRGEGSGFIIHKDGYILTNAHVIEGSDSLQVALSTGGLFKGRLIGMDQVADLALIKIDAPNALPVLPLGKSDQLKPGDWVMAIGSPFGLDLTVTVGIVSAKGRSLGATPYDDFIQTDTPINPGNSGGPLINIQGEVVGINTAVLQMGQGLGFSLPVDLAKKLIPELKAHGKVTRSWLGVSVQDITLTDKETLNLSVDQGSLVREVVVDSPAYKAGLKKNDVIVEFGGHAINNSRKLPKEVVYTPSGEEVFLRLVRDGKTMTIGVTLQPFPEHMMS
jgi:serine protease Do